MLSTKVKNCSDMTKQNTEKKNFEPLDLSYRFPNCVPRNTSVARVSPKLNPFTVKFAMMHMQMGCQIRIYAKISSCKYAQIGNSNLCENRI